MKINNKIKPITLLILAAFLLGPVSGDLLMPQAAEGASAAININKAGADELVRLPGVGAVTAERIVSYRKTHGPFKSVEELKNIKGIGGKRFEKIKEQVKIR